MFSIDHLCAKTPSGRIQNISFQLDRPEVHAILCPNVTFLDELVKVFLDKRLITSGSIQLDGRDFYQAAADGSVQMISGVDSLYNSLSVIDNIFINERKFFLFGRKRRTALFEKLLKETGFCLDGSVKVRFLSREQKKIVEILKCCSINPDLLIVWEVENFLSYKNYAIYLSILDRLCEKGTKILYLCSQWEDSVKAADTITIISHGVNYGTYSAEEAGRNPKQIFPVMMGAHYEDKGGKKDEKLEILRAINENMQELRECYDLRKALHVFSKYLLNELHASNSVFYLLDHHQGSLITVTARDDPQSEHLRLHQEHIHLILEKGEFFYISKNQSHFRHFFGREASHATALFYPCTIGHSRQLLIEVCYDSYYVYSEKDVLYLKWIAKEAGIIVENTNLMGNSVLLQESHHRIKNNLQIIVGLIELAKSELSYKITNKDPMTQASQILNEISGRVQSIAKAHNILCHKDVTTDVISLYAIVNEIARPYESLARIGLDFDEIIVPYGHAVSFALVANELITNSLKHNNGRTDPLNIHICAVTDAQMQRYRISYQDNGVGFSGTSDCESSDSVGAMLIHSIICIELHGEYRTYNENGAHTEIDIPIEFTWKNL